jgi:hypothetical protein
VHELSIEIARERERMAALENIAPR